MPGRSRYFFRALAAYAALLLVVGLWELAVAGAVHLILLAATMGGLLFIARLLHRRRSRRAAMAPAAPPADEPQR